MTGIDHMKLSDRLAWGKANLEPVQSDYVIVWESPDDLDAPAQVMIPDPNWMACALHGGILPPIEAYIMDRGVAAGELKEHPHAKPISPMIQEQAMEYMAMKNLPPLIVNAAPSNRRRFVICGRNQLPVAQNFRDAWALIQPESIHATA